jgi:hypothetical protein
VEDVHRISKERKETFWLDRITKRGNGVETQSGGVWSLEFRVVKVVKLPRHVFDASSLPR